MNRTPASDTMDRALRASRATAAEERLRGVVCGKVIAGKLRVAGEPVGPFSVAAGRDDHPAPRSTGLGASHPPAGARGRSHLTSRREAAGRRSTTNPVWIPRSLRRDHSASLRAGLSVEPGLATGPSPPHLRHRLGWRDDSALRGPPGWSGQAGGPACANAKVMPPRRPRRSRTLRCPNDPAAASYVQLTSVHALRMHRPDSDFGPGSDDAVDCQMRMDECVSFAQYGRARGPGGREARWVAGRTAPAAP